MDIPEIDRYLSSRASKKWRLSVRVLAKLIFLKKLKAWSTFEIDIAKEYHEAGWDMPKVVSFALITGASRAMRGEFAGFFAQIRLLESERS